MEALVRLVRLPLSSHWGDGTISIVLVGPGAVNIC